MNHHERSIILSGDLLCVWFLHLIGCCTYFSGFGVNGHSTESSLDTVTEVGVATSQNVTIEERAVMEMLQAQGLYYDLESILTDIERNKLKSGLMDLLSVHNRTAWLAQRRSQYQARDQIKKKKRMIFINIETIYSSKREMITKALARRMRGRHLTSPPKYMGDLRVILGHGLARRLYYSLTKYSTASHVQRTVPTQVVVLESSELPPRGHPMYQWPSDLLVPDVVFFINATKDVGPSTGFTQPYTAFTHSLITVYRRVEGVKVVEINPSPYYQSVVRYILDFLREHYSDHPDIMVPHLSPQPAVRNKR